MVERSIFRRFANSSWAHSCSSRYRLNESAFSIGLRSLRCRFSTIANSATSRSSASRTRAGICRPAGLNGRPQPPFARDQLVPITDAPHQHRLEHVVFFETLRERGDLRLAKVPPRLEGVVVDLVHVELAADPSVGRWCWSCMSPTPRRRGAPAPGIPDRRRWPSAASDSASTFVRGAQQGSQTASQATIFTHVPRPPCRVRYRHASREPAAHSRSQICRDWALPRRPCRAE